MSILNFKLYVEMTDGSIWAVPIGVIAQHRAEYYLENYAGRYTSLEEALEDIEKLFEMDFYEIKDWAEDNMDWEDVEEHAHKVQETKIDFQESWRHGYKEIGS